MRIEDIKYDVGNIRFKDDMLMDKKASSEGLQQEMTNNSYVQGTKSVYNHEVKPEYGYVLLKCKNCDKYNNWLKDHELVSMMPKTTALFPNLPEDIRSMYNQASSYYMTDPQKSARIMQEAINRLFDYYNEKGKTLKNSILNSDSEDSKKYQETLNAINNLNEPSLKNSGLFEDNYKLVSKNLFELFDSIIRLNSAILN